MMNDEPKFISDEEVEKIKKISEENEKKWSERIAAAKEEAAHIGKEPYDFEKLLTFITDFNIQDRMDDIELRETARANYEWRYYYNRDVMTLEEFAKVLDRAAMYD